MNRGTAVALLCAWVLWQEMHTKGEPPTWSVVSAWETSAECRASGDRVVANMQQQGSKVKGSRVETRHGKVLVTSFLTCLPDTVDPRR